MVKYDRLPFHFLGTLFFFFPFKLHFQVNKDPSLWGFRLFHVWINYKPSSCVFMLNKILTNINITPSESCISNMCTKELKTFQIVEKEY